MCLRREKKGKSKVLAALGDFVYVIQKLSRGITTPRHSLLNCRQLLLSSWIKLTKSASLKFRFAVLLLLYAPNFSETPPCLRPQARVSRTGFRLVRRYIYISFHFIFISFQINI